MFGRDLRNMNQQGQSLADLFDLKTYHNQGIKGQGIKIAIFDSGLSDIYSSNEDHSTSPLLPNVVKIIDFTHD